MQEEVSEETCLQFSVRKKHREEVKLRKKYLDQSIEKLSFLFLPFCSLTLNDEAKNASTIFVSFDFENSMIFTYGNKCATCSNILQGEMLSLQEKKDVH